MPNLDPNGLIFSTVTAFVEQVGRREVWRYGELDNMTCVWTGPSYAALGFRPKVETPHPEFPLMFCTDSEITNKEALIAEVTATYQGIIQTNGASSYVTPPVTTESPVQGARDFSIPYVSQSTAPVYTTFSSPGSPPVSTLTQPATYDYGTYSITVRYIGVQCNVRYMSYPRPTSLKYSSLGKSRVTWSILSQFIGPRQVAGSGVSYDVAQWETQHMGNPQTVPALFAAYLGVTLVQKGKWYECTETYGPSF